MQHGAMADVSVLLHDRVARGKAVHHARVLQIRALLQNDSPEVAAQARGRSDVAARPNDDVADEDCSRVNVCGRIDHWHETVDFVAGHGGAVRAKAASLAAGPALSDP